ncbi:hypothetical protein AB0L65_61315 [Nonomuraea sp. NPDC052116]|uniref:hypothetical protein n=1 Tax=Nonomuraea sp. NPDC052116 TaxID=3155665 RepID=UPI00341DCBAC
MDVGGPGVAVLSGQVRLPQLARTVNDLGLAYNLLFLEEPWVLKASPSNCSRALSELVRRIRTRDESSPTNDSTDVATKCFPEDSRRSWGFTSDSYNKVLQQVAAQESLRYSGFIGHSFGAVRLGYLRHISLDWSILTRPFPVGVDGRQIVNARARAIEGMQRRVTGHQGMPRALILAEAERRFDYLSALVEVGYTQTPAFTRRLARLDSDAQAAQRLAQQYWGIYGAGAVSPAYLAYLEEVCSAGKGWPYSYGRYNSVTSVLEAKHASCFLLKRKPAELIYGNEPRCIVTSSSDTVTPASLVAKSVLSRGRAIWVSSRERAHASFDQLDVCLKRLAGEKPAQ